MSTPDNESALRGGASDTTDAPLAAEDSTAVGEDCNDAESLVDLREAQQAALRILLHLVRLEVLLDDEPKRAA